MMKYTGKAINAGTILYDTINDNFWICCYIEDISDPDMPEGEELYFGYNQDSSTGVKYQFTLSHGYTATIIGNEIRNSNITIGFSNKWVLNRTTGALKKGLSSGRFIKVKQVLYHEMADFLEFIKHLDDCDDDE